MDEVNDTKGLNDAVTVEVKYALGVIEPLELTEPP